nr:hypothetical protein [Tanacetum cinerariifolium]
MSGGFVLTIERKEGFTIERKEGFTIERKGIPQMSGTICLTIERKKEGELTLWKEGELTLWKEGELTILFRRRVNNFKGGELAESISEGELTTSKQEAS